MAEGNESRGHFGGEKEETLLHYPLREQCCFLNLLDPVLVWKDNQSAEHSISIFSREERKCKWRMGIYVGSTCNALQMTDLFYPIIWALAMWLLSTWNEAGTNWD